MARELLSESRILEGATAAEAHGAATNDALGKITERWNAGHGAPGEETHVRNVHLHDKEGEIVGFRLYLVWSEPLRYGKAEVEVLED